MECAYCVLIVLIWLNALLIFVTRSFSFAPKLFLNEMCVVALAPATKTISGAMSHPHVMMLLTSG